MASNTSKTKSKRPRHPISGNIHPKRGCTVVTSEKKTAKERLSESRSLLKEAYGTCFAIYCNNEPEKGDSFRDLPISELEKKLLSKIYEHGDLRKPETLCDLVNYSLMLIVRMKEPTGGRT